VDGWGWMHWDSFKLVTSHGFSHRLGDQMGTGSVTTHNKYPVAYIYEILKAIYISDMCAFT